MKNGLILEDGVPTYYEDDKPVHKGIIKVGDDIYYIGKDGKAEKGHKIVHSSMTHHIIKHGTYKFGDDYKLLKDYYKPAKKRSSHKSFIKRLIKKSSNSKNKDTKAAIGVCVALVFALATVLTLSAVLNSFNPSADTDSSKVAQSVELLRVSVPETEGEVWLVNDAAKKIYTEGADLQAVKNNYPYQPFYFSYSITCSDLTRAENIVAKLYISEESSMANSTEYEIDPTLSKIAIDNLKVDTTYYYRLEVFLDSDGKVADGSFKTAATHRFLNIPNLENVRDVGGRKTEDGRTVKQNMIIRGTEADGLVVNSYYLKDEYIEYVRKTFGFKFDMDLRNSAVGYPDYVSRFGGDVRHEFFDSPNYASTVSEVRWETVYNIISALANGENYPMYLHCSYGKDRTGTVVYLLDAILGLSDEEKMTEFDLSPNVDRENIQNLINALEPYSGDTINEKVVSFLTQSVGITYEQIESIRNIMLTE